VGTLAVEVSLPSRHRWRERRRHHTGTRFHDRFRTV